MVFKSVTTGFIRLSRKHAGQTQQRKGETAMKKGKYFVLLMTAVIALLVMSMPLYASKMDDRIESSAKKSYVFKNYLKGDDIKIQSKDGAVTLTGTVAQESHKELAEKTVESLGGVKSVDNKLEVKGERPAEKSDPWLKAKVKAALLFHRNVSATKTEVEVKDGIATLRGEASSEAQKELTTEYVKGVEGIKDVRNEMTVSKSGKKTSEKMGGKIDDASVTAQVKLTLLYHRSTSALKTKVETNHGVVTLGGKAKNEAEKDLVTKLVTDIKGVKSVKNQMTVEK
jgi:hyperosmotically inducible periplasmic protein